MGSESEVKAQALYVGTVDRWYGGFQLLVTVWEDGTAEVAFRPPHGGTWGPPHPLQSMPTE